MVPAIEGKTGTGTAALLDRWRRRNPVLFLLEGVGRQDNTPPVVTAVESLPVNIDASNVQGRQALKHLSEIVPTFFQ